MVAIDVLRRIRRWQHFNAVVDRLRHHAIPGSVLFRISILMVLAPGVMESGALGIGNRLLRADESRVRPVSSASIDGQAEAADRQVRHLVEAYVSFPSVSRELTDSRRAKIVPPSVNSTDGPVIPVPTLLPDGVDSTPHFASSSREAGEILAKSVQGRLQEADLLVVWLLDTSKSAAGERGQMALGLDVFFQHFSHTSENQHRLLSALVGFGSEMKELVAPTDSHVRITDVVRRLPSDPTGTENTFEAVEECVAAFRRKCPNMNILIVTWTDESGDDSQRLEGTIEVCRANGVSVTVVGPMAVLGADTATEPFVDSVVGETHQLPVTRGPDSAIPERIELGYWFLTQQPNDMEKPDQGFTTYGLPSWFGAGNRVFGDHKCIAATQVELPTWYGDKDLIGLVSGFGPYALTRLSVQTGGIYVVLADEYHAGPFRPDAMRDYLPDYRSADAVLHEIESKPLRRAVMEAVEMTRRKEIGPPPTLFFGRQSEMPPYGFMRDYYTPAGFAKKVRMVRRRLKTQSTRTSEIVEQALASLSERETLEVGLEPEYEREASRRWRAWYDLVRGRLLATSVRLEEYRKTCDAIVEPGFLEETTNFAVLVPSAKLKSNSTYRYRAEEAERLLLRCVRENPNTPWAFMAQRELDYAWGIDVRQFTTSLTMMPNSYVNAQLTLPKF